MAQVVSTINKRGKLDIVIPNMFSNPTYSKFLFYATMISQCSIQMDPNLPAAAGVSFNIDHYNLYINPTLFDEFTLEQQMGVLKHEMLHILNLHVQRADDRVHLPWNYSTDCAINQLIERKFLPEYAIYPDNFPVPNCPAMKDAELYYDLLKKEAEEQEDKCDECGGSGETEPDDDGETHECESCKGKGTKPSYGSGKGQLIDDHGTWEESKGDIDLQKDITKNMIDKSIEQTQKSRGELPEQLSEFLKLVSRNSEVSWKKVLRGIVGNKRVNKRSTIMKSNRRFPKREDLKGKTKDRMFNVLIVSDVSGSVSDTALLELLGEVKHICDVTKSEIDLIQIDTVPQLPEKLTKNTKIIQRKAGGGTYLHKALDMARDHKIDFNAVVVTTDGYLDETDVRKITSCGKRVIWLIEAGGHIMDGMNSGKSQAFQMKGV